MLLYEKEKGLVKLNPTGALIWSLCNGRMTIREIAEKVKNITTGGRQKK